MSAILKNFLFCFLLSKVSIIQYLDLAYEKRLNLTRTSFTPLVEASGEILYLHYNIEQDCVQGKPLIHPKLVKVSNKNHLYAVVTSVLGRGKIHLGTRADCEMLVTRAEGGGYTFSLPKDQGRTIPSVFFEKIGEMYTRGSAAWDALM